MESKFNDIVSKVLIDDWAIPEIKEKLLIILLLIAILYLKSKWHEFWDKINNR